MFQIGKLPSSFATAFAIIANNYKQDVQVKAEDKKTAENMVDNVLLGTDLFDFKNKCDYELKIRRMKGMKKSAS